MQHYAGWPINWAQGVGAFNIKMHPLYIKYNTKTFADIVIADVKTDLNQSLATAEGAAVIAYLSWVLRTKALLA